MNKNLQSPTKLTEFAPLQSEEKQQTVGQLISKFFKLNKNSPNGDSSATNLEKNSAYGSQESLPTWAIDNTEIAEKPNSTSSYYQVDVTEGRSLPNVLKRISNLLALKSSNLQAYSDTDLKLYWMPDSVSKECYECSEKFTTFRRRHHCRVCGQIFCSQCCNQQIPGKIFGCTGDLRVCTYCCKVVLSYLQSPDVGADLTADLRALQENLFNKYGATSPSGTSLSSSSLALNIASNSALECGGSGTLRRKISVGYQEEKFALGRSVSNDGLYLSAEEKCKVLQSSVSLRNLYEEMCRTTTGVPLQTHKFRLRTYTGCFLGSELVNWLIYQQKANTRIQAAAICQALLEGSYIECLSEPCSFVDGYTLYKLGYIASNDLLTSMNTYDVPNQDEPSWIQQVPQESSATDSETEEPSPTSSRVPGHLASSSSYLLDLNVEANTVYLSRPPPSMLNLDSPETLGDKNFEKQIICEEAPVVKTSEQREFVPESGWYNALHLRDENGEKHAYNIISNSFKQHENNLLNQLLSIHGLSATWVDIIIPLIHKVIDNIRPDKDHSAQDIDIRQYVKFKKVSGGTRNDNTLIEGIVCSKNVIHKNMSSKLENPKILLLECSLVYQRTEGRLMSLEPILMQELEYLRNVVARITALQPDLILVQRNVSRLAQDLLREQGMTLVVNVKQNILECLARCTQADIVTSMDAHIGRPRLGTCKYFYLKTFQIESGGSKTLMFFEGLPLAHLGGTVLLRGASKIELVRIKQVASFFLFACYNWRLEKSYLMDEFAELPTRKDEFFDDSKETSPDIPVGKSMPDEIKLKAEQISAGLTNGEICSSTPNSNKIFRKEDSRTVIEFDDPLMSGNMADNVFKSEEKLSVAELPFSNNFRKSLDDTILCISPHLVFSLPYLETEMGKKCKLRCFFPSEIFFSKQFSAVKKTKALKDLENHKYRTMQKINLKPPHPFITARIRTNADNVEFQNLLANFRACGGRFEFKEMFNNGEADVDTVSEYKPANESELNHLDALDPTNHQRLAVLFCSFSHTSHNAPAFCVKMVVYMEFYGVNDIPLGCFLERYCFRSAYKCASETCDTPMLKHIRRFVHNGGCLSLSLNSFDNEFGEDGIVMWSWCSKCQTVSPVVPMSKDTWSFSFAKFLELRFHGGMYIRRGNPGCQHSLHHDHYQYFGYKNLVASFKYTSIQLWEISLPPALIKIHYDVVTQHKELIDEIKALALKGHDIYSAVNEKISLLPSDFDGLVTFKQILTKEQATFKQKIEEVQLKLTSPTVEFKDFAEVDIAAIWYIEDAVTRVKRLLVECIDQWNTRIGDCLRRKDADKKRDKSIPVDIENITPADTVYTISDTIGTTNSESMAGLSTKKIKSLDQGDAKDDSSTSSSPKVHHRSQSDGTVITQYEESYDNKKEIDKKTVKTILSQLLPSSVNVTPIPQSFNSQEHYVSASGVSHPVIVYEQEPSSIVAYALNSHEYKKGLEEISGRRNQSAEASPITAPKRRSNSDKIDNAETTGILSFLRNRDSKSDLLSVSSGGISDTCGQPDDSVVSDKLDDLKKNKNTHVEVQFSDNNCNFFCRVYHAEQFAWLRSLVLPTGEEAFIRSLSRCVQWNAQGGKSGSTFCKTKDDRFVLKELPKSEIQLFLESAHNYFLYMQRCFTSGHPTLLGKIVGIYQVIFRNSTSNATLRTNLLVMENLFYKRTVTHKFDLKGSMRNRLVNSDNQDGEIVLLDENLLKMTCETPLYILPHSKAVLTAAIHNDTEFLSEQSVMDYSLLVGLDSGNKELVLGIIDYIRTFTWDKKLETMVKKSGLLGGQGKLPTIISPKEYRKRFIEAMHRYFLVVPDHWAGLGRGLEC